MVRDELTIFSSVACLSINISYQYYDSSTYKSLVCRWRVRRIRNHACAKCQESSVPCSYTMQLCEGEISSQLALGSLSWNLVWHEFGFSDEDIYGPKQSHS